MITQKSKIALPLFFVLLFCTQQMAIGSALPIEEDSETFTNENIVVEVTGGVGNVPKFSFWNPENTSDVYQLIFIQCFEAVDENENGAYDFAEDSKIPSSVIALPSWTWVFSEVVEEDDKLHMNITSVGEDFEIQFCIHFGNDSSMKFDIIISEYVFDGSDENTLLVIGFKLMSTHNTAKRQITDRNRVNIGGSTAYLKNEPTALANEEQVKAKTSLGNDSVPMAYISFEKFNGTLIYDPTIGLAADSTVLIIIGVCGGIIAVAIIGVVIYRKKVCPTGGISFLCKGIIPK